MGKYPAKTRILLSIFMFLGYCADIMNIERPLKLYICFIISNQTEKREYGVFQVYSISGIANCTQHKQDVLFVIYLTHFHSGSSQNSSIVAF